MPRLRAKRTVREPKSEPFVFTQAVCVESFAVGWSDPIAKGRVYPADHWAVSGYPAYWRLLGPRPDEGVTDG